MELDKMQLPKVNERKQQSKIQQNKLMDELLETIKIIELENNYKFYNYEIDNVFLELIKRHHETYLNMRFGFDSV